MEGQGFNPTPGAAPTPTPEPAPAPGPEPAPEMTFVSGPTEEVATEPIPQDSFAQPTVSSGASWQPTQATAPGVGNMNTAPMGPVPEPKKGGSGMIIAIIAAAVILIGLIVAIIVVIASGNNGGSNTSTTKTGTSGKDSGGSGSGSGTGNNTEDFQRAQRNTQREDDVARLLTAVNDYQTNNNGKTPFGSGYYDKTTITNFVVRYIDADIDRDGVAEGKSFVCKKSSCPQFTDPDGTVYGFTVDLAKSGKRNEKIAYSGNVDHLFHVYVTAGCGEDSDTYTTGTGNRQIAVFYIEEGGDIVCNDNH